MTRKYNALVVGVLCLLLGLGAARGLADIASWSTSAASNTSSIGTEGMSESNLPSTVNDSYREGLAQITRLARQAVLSSFGPATYTVSTYWITPALVPAAAISGQVFSFVPTTRNVGSATLQIGSIAGKTIVKLSNSTLDTGDLQAGTAAMVVDGGTYYHLLNPTVNSITDSGITTSMLAANSVTLSKIAAAATGSLITWDTTRAAAVITPGTSGQVLTSRGAASTPVFQTSSTSGNDFLLYQDQKANGTAGNGYTADTWNTVILNTEVTDTAAIGSLGSNRVTLPTGSYFVEAAINPGTYGAGNAQARARLYNVSDSSTTVQGTNQAQPGSGMFFSVLTVHGAFTITQSRAFELQVWPTDTTTGQAGVSTGEVEIYGSVLFRRYAD